MAAVHKLSFRKGTGSRHLVFFLVLVMAMVLAGGIASAAEKIKLHYLTWAGPPGSDYIREDFIEPFEKLHPNIEIEYEYTSFAQFPQKYMAYYAAGNPPDLMHISVGWVYDWAKQGMLADLQPYFNRDLNPRDFFMEPFKAMRYPSQEGGDLYGIPFAFVLTTLFVNNSMFDNMGLAPANNNLSYYDVRDIARKLTKDTNGDGLADQWGFYSAPTYTTLDPVIHAFGGSILDDKFNVTLLGEKAMNAARFMVDLIHKDQVAPNPAVVKDSGISLFTKGQMGMLIENVSQLSGFRTSSKFDWDTVLMPKGPEKRAVRLWPDSFAVSSQSKNKEAAWEYIKFVITQKKVDRYSGARKVPVYRQLAAAREWLEEDQKPNKKVFIESVQYGDPMEFRPRWGDWDSARGKTLAPAWRGETSIEAAMTNTAQVIQQIINEK